LVDEVLAEENIGSGGVRDVLWAMTDHQGSVRDLARVTAGTASVVNHIVYDAFGKTVSETDAAIAHLYGFTGRELDKETGLQYNRARYLDLVLARWISQDPKSFAAGDTNLYRYVGNHPSYATDPSGLAEWDPKVIREAIRAADSDFAALFDYHVVTLEPTKESSPIVGYALPSYRYINAYYPENWSNEQVIDAIFANTSTWSDSDLLDYVATASKHFGRYTNPMGYPRNWIGSRGDLVAELQAEQRDKYRKAVAQIAPLITDSMRSFPLFGEGAYATYMIVDGRAIEYATGIVKDSVAAASALGEFARENPKLLIAGGAAVVIVGVDGKILKKFDAPKEALVLPRSLGAKGVINVESKIKNSPYAIRQAEALGQHAQKDVDNLLVQLANGNANPGIGTRALGNGFFELRGRNAGRVIIKQIDDHNYDIVGKFQGHAMGDAANSNVINRLMGEYSK